MPETHTTPHGSPCSRTWTSDWVAVVEAREESLERRICGARLMSGNPCTLVSTHPSGRCRYHGGFDLTGAPEGNRNAVLHNLYSRRLMPCGPHCPIWQSCPLTFSLGKEKVSKEKPLAASGCADGVGISTSIGGASPTLQDSFGERESKQRETVAALSRGGDTYGGAGGSPAEGGSGAHGGLEARPTDTTKAIPSIPTDRSVAASFGSTFSSPEEKVESRFIPSGYAQEILALNPADRPTCPYEQTEYNTAVSDALQSVPQKRTRAYARHIVHQLALAQVMVTRAGLALREAEFTKPLVITGEKYHMTTPKIAPALTAYEKLERAWRRVCDPP